MQARAWLKRSWQAARMQIPVAWEEGPSPWFVAGVVLAASAAQVGVQRLGVAGGAYFDRQVYVGGWALLVPMLFAAWALAGDASRKSLPGWWVVWTGAVLPATLISLCLQAALAREIAVNPWAAWVAQVLLGGWAMFAGYFASRSILPRWRAASLVAVAAAASVAYASWMRTEVWYADHAEDEETTPRFHLTQRVFEDQQKAWRDAAAALLPQRAGVRDVYGIVFAPHAGEDVFLRESAMVGDVLATRFDAQGRVLRLVNHATTASTLPWATPENLERAIAEIARRMDPAEDVLVVYLTSHGGKDAKLSAYHWPLDVEDATPALLAQALDAAHVRNRVLIVSACYSGTWVDPLKGPTSLVMTAADATHTSYGCGHRSPLTYFGRALFDEQLRQTHSFEKAFNAAVPVIRQREVEGRKQDGFSNPQISIGEQIRPVLQELEQRLDAAKPA